MFSTNILHLHSKLLNIKCDILWHSKLNSVRSCWFCTDFLTFRVHCPLYCAPNAEKFPPLIKNPRPLPLLVHTSATFSLSNYVISGLLKVQANHHHGEPLTLSANLWGLEKRDLYQSGRADAWLGAADRESGPLIRTPNPVLTDRFVFTSPSVWPRSAGTRRSADMHRELPASRDWRSLTGLFKQNTIKPEKAASARNPNNRNNRSFPPLFTPQKPRDINSYCRNYRL